MAASALAIWQAGADYSPVRKTNLRGRESDWSLTALMLHPGSRYIRRSEDRGAQCSKDVEGQKIVPMASTHANAELSRGRNSYRMVGHSTSLAILS